MSSIEKMTFCLMEAIGRTLLRFPWLIWIEVKTLLCFESVLFQDDCPYFLGKLFSGNGFIPKCITKFAICTWCALNTVSSCFIFLFSPFSLHLSQNWFLFRNFSSFFLFFLGVITEKLCFFKILNIALFHDSLVCNDINAHTFMVGFFEKSTFFETEINEILISHLNRFQITWAGIHPSFWIFFKLFSWHWGRQQN